MGEVRVLLEVPGLRDEHIDADSVLGVRGGRAYGVRVDMGDYVCDAKIRNAGNLYQKPFEFFFASVPQN